MGLNKKYIRSLILLIFCIIVGCNQKSDVCNVDCKSSPINTLSLIEGSRLTLEKNLDSLSMEEFGMYLSILDSYHEDILTLIDKIGGIDPNQIELVKNNVNSMNIFNDFEEILLKDLNIAVDSLGVDSRLSRNFNYVFNNQIARFDEVYFMESNNGKLISDLLMAEQFFINAILIEKSFRNP